MYFYYNVNTEIVNKIAIVLIVVKGSSFMIHINVRKFNDSLTIAKKAKELTSTFSLVC